MASPVRGGKGLGARYLYEELPPGVDPLGPENALAFVLGPLTGYLPGETRFAAVTKSPLTGAFLDSYCGGAFPGALAAGMLFVFAATGDPRARGDGDARGRLLGVGAALLASLFVAAMVAELLL